MQLNCVVTDDEPVAAEILEDYVRLIPGLQLVGTCRDALETNSLLRRQAVDVLFMDIQMPGISGMDFIRSLRQPPAVVFTTAHPGYAVDAFELDVVDYLLKPISIDRFLRAVNKLFARIESAAGPAPADGSGPAADEGRKYFFIKSNQDLVRVAYSDIMYVEGLENYVKIHCTDRILISFATMKSLEEQLSPYRFLRIHRSFIVNLDKVVAIRNGVFFLHAAELAIGKSYRKPVTELLKQYYSM